MKYFLNTVLLIDDNEIDNIINSKIISLGKFAENVFVKQSCEDAIQLLKDEYSLNNNIPDLIFLDIRMPLFDGFDFLNSFEDLDENIKSKVKIIMLTSSIDNGDLSRAKNNKYVMKLMNKPLSVEALEELRKSF